MSEPMEMRRRSRGSGATEARASDAQSSSSALPTGTQLLEADKVLAALRALRLLNSKSTLSTTQIAFGIAYLDKAEHMRNLTYEQQRQAYNLPVNWTFRRDWLENDPKLRLQNALKFTRLTTVAERESFVCDTQSLDAPQSNRPKEKKRGTPPCLVHGMPCAPLHKRVRATDALVSKMYT